MTVLDTTGAVDLLYGEGGAAAEVEALIEEEGVLAAPDLLVFEVLAVLRRDLRRGIVRLDRAEGAIGDLADVPVDLYPTLPFRERAWELRDNLSASDALFAALADELGEPLATKDRRLARAARKHAGIEVIELSSG